MKQIRTALLSIQLRIFPLCTKIGVTEKNELHCGYKVGNILFIDLSIIIMWWCCASLATTQKNDIIIKKNIFISKYLYLIIHIII